MLNKKLVLGSLAGATLLVGAAILVPTAAVAGVVGGTCVTCHTMHDSVEGADQGVANAQEQLLKFAGCAGCHAVAANDGTGRGGPQVAPQVGTAASITQNTAGYFNVDADSHSVGGSITGLTGGLNPAPGGTMDGSGTNFTCEDCHTAAIGGHHAAAGTTGYRFIAAVTVGAEAANYGQAATVSTYDATMNTFCASCHAQFHGTAAVDDTTAASGAGAWIRHPTDVASSHVSDAAIPTTSVGNNVMCISCHKPHGSGLTDLIRFDYTLQQANSTNGDGAGCELCHGAK